MVRTLAPVVGRVKDMKMVQEKKRRLNSEDWLRAALDALAKLGIEGVRVLPLAKALGVSRGSFYWHFKNRRELLDRLLEYWDRWSTETVIQQLSSRSYGAKERIWALIELIENQGLGRYDPAIRAWATYDRRAAAAVRGVDRKRIAFVTGLFREAGFPAEQAEARARLLAVYTMGDHMVLVSEPAARRRKLQRLRHRILTSP
jgi:AcrR family transcriptional regulator